MMVDAMPPPGAGQTVSTMARKPRNPVARSPLLRKGGVHRKSRSAERMQSKRELKDEAKADRETEGDTEEPREPGAEPEPER